MVRFNANEEAQRTGPSCPGGAVTPVLAVPRPASVSFRVSSVEQILAARRAARIRLADDDTVAGVVPACKQAAVRLER